MAFAAVVMISVAVQSNVQVYSVFFVVLALHAILRAGSGRIGWLILAGVWLGLAVGSKYAPLVFAGMLCAPYARARWGARAAPSGTEHVPSPGETLSSRVWAGGVGIVIVLAGAGLWIGMGEREWTFALLRDLYQLRPHENPFEHHLAWIDRLYRGGLAAMALAGAIAALALAVPWCRRVSAWPWARSFCARNRLWLVPCGALFLTIGVTIGLPAVANLGDFAAQIVGIAKMQSTGDNGMFPASRPAVSYIAGYLPENMGLALFFAGLVGLVYAVITRDAGAIVLIASVVPAYIALEMSRVKVNRYALELTPVWCVLAAVWLARLSTATRRVWRLAGTAAVVGVVAYSLVYTLGWAEFASPRGDVLKETARWVNTAIPPGASLGVKSTLLVNGSPELLPDAGSLARYRLVEYRDDPEYVLLPNGVYAIMTQYLDASRAGYVYTPSDWYPSAPSREDLAALARIVRGDGYVLAKEFRKRPVVLGRETRSDSLNGRTWYVEHNVGVGIRVYRRLKERG
jgi:hypothetical protein